MHYTCILYSISGLFLTKWNYCRNIEQYGTTDGLHQLADIRSNEFYKNCVLISTGY